jgi:ABC-type multidrug transport system fused ATPase/permease subunit
VNPLSGVFGEAWELYKGHWSHFALIALLVFVVVAAIGIVLALLLGWFGAVLGAIVSFVGWYWLQGALIEAVRDVRDGRADLSVSETFARVQPRLGSIIGAGILLGIGVGIGFVLFVVPGLFLLTIWIAVIPALVLESRGIGESFGRSRELVSGNGWNVFGVIVLTILLLIGVWLVLSLVLTPLADWLASLIGQAVNSLVIGPFVVTIWTLVYYRLKAREEEAAAPAAPAPEPVT